MSEKRWRLSDCREGVTQHWGFWMPNIFILQLTLANFKCSLNGEGGHARTEILEEKIAIFQTMIVQIWVVACSKEQLSNLVGFVGTKNMATVVKLVCVLSTQPASVVISQTHRLVSQERLSLRVGTSVFIDLIPIMPSGEQWF